MNNPYSAPTADLSIEPNLGDTYEPAVYSVRGRIGRLRYLAYSWLWMIPVVLVTGLLVAFAGMAGAQLDLISYLTWLVVLPLVVRRLHDLERNGWLAVLMLIPILNIPFGLYLLFAPGSNGTNKYGPAPCKNPRMMAVWACLIPVVIVGILAAIAIPAYQSYVNKAKAASAAAQGTVQQP